MDELARLRMENYQLRDTMKALEIDLKSSLNEIQYITEATPVEFAIDLLKTLERKINERLKLND